MPKAPAKTVLMGPGGPVTSACHDHTTTRVIAVMTGGMSHGHGAMAMPIAWHSRVAAPTTRQRRMRLGAGDSRPTFAAMAPSSPSAPFEGPRMSEVRTRPVATAATQPTARRARPGAGWSVMRLRPRRLAPCVPVLSAVDLML